MKKILLTVAALAIATASFAQTFDALSATTYDQHMGTGNSSCWVNQAGPVGLLTAANGNVLSVGMDANKFMTVTAKAATTTTGQTITWWNFVYTSAICDHMKDAGGVNMSAAGHGKILVRAKSDIPATVVVYIGSTPLNQWYPNDYSTYNVGDAPGTSIPFVMNLTTSFADYTFDYEAADNTHWILWAKRDVVNSFAFDPQTDNAVVTIERVQVGSAVVVLGTNDITADNNAITIAPNPASDVVNVKFNNMDENGAVAKMINANGTVVYEGALTNGTISLAGFNKGIYMLQVTSGNKVATQKVVVQ